MKAVSFQDFYLINYFLLTGFGHWTGLSQNPIPASWSGPCRALNR